MPGNLIGLLMTYLALSIAIFIASLFAKRSWLYIAALLAWIASEAATQFFILPPVVSSIGYLLFYPLIFVAIPALFEISQETELIRLIDGAVLVLGSSTIATALLAHRIPADFLYIFYPICDLVLLIAALICFVRRPINLRSFLVLIGFLLYTATDFIYLIQVANHQYHFDSYLNYGWLAGFGYITFALFRRGIKSEAFPPVPNFYFALSVLSSSLILTMIALQLFDIPRFVIAPALATLITSFIRMAVALKQSEHNAYEKNLAKIDDLTGLPNRRRFITEIDKYTKGSVLLMDLDGFKPVNDQFGHEVGDEILKQVAGRFQRTMPDGALLARLGGDEFAVLTRQNYEAAMELAMALHATLSYPFNVAGSQIKVDVSIGCIEIDGAGDLMARADTAMYQAKKSQVGVWAGGT